MELELVCCCQNLLCASCILREMSCLRTARVFLALRCRRRVLCKDGGDWENLQIITELILEWRPKFKHLFIKWLTFQLTKLLSFLCCCWQEWESEREDLLKRMLRVRAFLPWIESLCKKKKNLDFGTGRVVKKYYFFSDRPSAALKQCMKMIFKTDLARAKWKQPVSKNASAKCAGTLFLPTITVDRLLTDSSLKLQKILTFI